MLFASVFAVSLLLAGCAPSLAPAGPAVMEPELTSDAIVAADGAKLPLRVWTPEGQPRAVILALHGYTDYSHAFALPAPYFTERGIAIYAYDQRGFGAAPGRGRWAGEATMLADIRAAASLVKARNPGVPFYILGESMGGAETIVAMTGPNAPQVSGVILSAPAVWARQRMNVFERAALWASSNLFPWFHVNGSGLNIQASDNLAMLREMSRDPLVQKDSRIDLLEGVVDLMDHAYANAARLPAPALILYGEHDEIVPPEPSYDAMASLDGKPGVVRAVYPQGWHLLLRDLGAKTVLADIVSWVADPGAPLPSGADRNAESILAKRRAPERSAAN